MHASFVSATRAHNGTFDLHRFDGAPDLGLDVMHVRRSQRGSLFKDRFELAYLQYWAVRFCQESCPSMLDEIDLCWPLDRILSMLNDPFWCQLRDEALEHSKSCDARLCGEYVHIDGNAKVFRDCCHNKDEELFQTAIGGVVKGCPRSPLKSSRYCALHKPVQPADQAECNGWTS
jgi:hypothetical protein